MPWAPPVTIVTLPARVTPGPGGGDQAVGVRIRLCCSRIRGCSCATTAFHSLARGEPGPAGGPVGQIGVAPHVHDHVELAHVGRGVPADQVAEDRLLHRQPLGLVDAQVLGHLAGVQAVDALLDDHRSIPPNATYLSSSQSSMP